MSAAPNGALTIGKVLNRQLGKTTTPMLVKLCHHMIHLSLIPVSRS